MALVEIKGVDQPEAVGHGMLGCRLDSPKPPARSDTYGFELVGWALAEAGPLAKIEALQEGRVVALAEPEDARPDIAAAFPVEHADRAGFRISVSALDLRQDFELTVIARAADGLHARIATLSGERAPLPAAGEELLQPLIVNTIGRSGSTWLVWLLSCLPEAVAFRAWRGRRATWRSRCRGRSKTGPGGSTVPT